MLGTNTALVCLVLTKYTNNIYKGGAMEFIKLKVHQFQDLLAKASCVAVATTTFLLLA
jgi:hypothetical protein